MSSMVTSDLSGACSASLRHHSAARRWSPRAAASAASDPSASLYTRANLARSDSTQRSNSGVSQEEAIQERSGVERSGALHLGPTPRITELRDVAGDLLWVEPKIARALKQRLGAEVATQYMQQLIQGVRSLGVSGLGPEECVELVPAEAAVITCGEQGEDRQWLPPGNQGARGLPRRLHCWSAEK